MDAVFICAILKKWKVKVPRCNSPTEVQWWGWGGFGLALLELAT